ncbi:hypothetical protein BXY85_2215 [Roseivirga pacifica]|uniref:Uncharacterized protein n=1 Tax=Roseivirga pacifica TaxID=1267423 RepID=A0A1I0NHX9_9BACT|nr:hypothetical protein [Roseivirga pacifica]RKQ51193.1 hypothetical protein BXY85_2215 [Roseivirga pacifica]SEW00733.1 hypothetical protein SAMN05216290_1197 [Roseivirga pacifica]
MKIKKQLFGLDTSLVLVVLLFGCQSSVKKQAEVAEERIEEYLETQVELVEKPIQLTGLWMFEDVHASEELQEHHYMVIEGDGDELVGWYYGTTDDFDDAREGYYPGFYVSAMQDLILDGDSLRFSISINEEKLYTKPVPLTLTENDSIDLPKWDIGVTYFQRDYVGIVRKERIEFDIYLRRYRIFKRADSK